MPFWGQKNISKNFGKVLDFLSPRGYNKGARKGNALNRNQRKKEKKMTKKITARVKKEYNVHLTDLEKETLRHMISYGFFFDNLDDGFVCWGVEGKRYRGCQTTLNTKGVVSVWNDDGDTLVYCGKGYTKHDLAEISGWNEKHPNERV